MGVTRARRQLSSVSDPYTHPLSLSREMGLTLSKFVWCRRTPVLLLVSGVLKPLCTATDQDLVLVHPPTLQDVGPGTEEREYVLPSFHPKPEDPVSSEQVPPLSGWSDPDPRTHLDVLRRVSMALGVSDPLFGVHGRVWTLRVQEKPES